MEEFLSKGVPQITGMVCIVSKLLEMAGIIHGSSLEEEEEEEHVPFWSLTNNTGKPKFSPILARVKEFVLAIWAAVKEHWEITQEYHPITTKQIEKMPPKINTVFKFPAGEDGEVFFGLTVTQHGAIFTMLEDLTAFVTLHIDPEVPYISGSKLPIGGLVDMAMTYLDTCRQVAIARKVSDNEKRLESNAKKFVTAQQKKDGAMALSKEEFDAAVAERIVVAREEKAKQALKGSAGPDAKKRVRNPDAKKRVKKTGPADATDAPPVKRAKKVKQAAVAADPAQLEIARLVSLVAQHKEASVTAQAAAEEAQKMMGEARKQTEIAQEDANFFKRQTAKAEEEARNLKRKCDKLGEQLNAKLAPFAAAQKRARGMATPAGSPQGSPIPELSPSPEPSSQGLGGRGGDGSISPIGDAMASMSNTPMPCILGDDGFKLHAAIAPPTQEAAEMLVMPLRKSARQASKAPQGNKPPQHHGNPGRCGI